MRNRKRTTSLARTGHIDEAREFPTTGSFGSAERRTVIGRQMLQHVESSVAFASKLISESIPSNPVGGKRVDVDDFIERREDRRRRG
jgi:hypothetical protein